MNHETEKLYFFLRNTIPFCYLPSQSYSTLVSSLRIQRLESGQLLFEAGDRNSDGIYLLTEGELELRGPRGESPVLPGQGDQASTSVRLDAGRYIGDYEAIFDLPPLYSARAVSEAVCWTLERKYFLELVSTHASFTQSLATVLRDRQGIFKAFDRFRAELMRGITVGRIDIVDLLPLYQDLEPALHPRVSSEDVLDIGALTYAVRRLPENITRTFALLLRDELPEVFDTPSEYFPEQRTQARRRAVWEMLPGKDLVLLRSGLSDLTDLVTCLCLYAVEARKIRRRLYKTRAFPRMKAWRDSVEPSHREDLTSFMKKLGLEGAEAAELRDLWSDESVSRLYEIGAHREMFSIDVRRQRDVYSSRRTELWTSQISMAVRELTGLRPNELDHGFPVHVVSSNTHSLTNCLNPWFRRKGPDILAWARNHGHAALGYSWKLEEDLIYALSRDYLRAFPGCEDELENEGQARGIIKIRKTLSTGIEVQLIDCSCINPQEIDPFIAGIPAAGSQRGLVVNIDYAFGEQAEHVLRNLSLLFQRNIASVSFLGKAGALNGARGDLLVPSCFIHQEGDELQEPIQLNQAALDRLRAAVGKDRVQSGPMVTVEGTLLQNRMMLNYYRRLWGAVGIEMEGYYYQHQVLEGMRTGLLKPGVKQQYYYYVSDLPLGSGHNLAVPLATAEGIPPLYAATREVLGSILLL